MSQMVQKTVSASQAPKTDGAVSVSVMAKSHDPPLPEGADDSVGATGAVHRRNDGYPSCATEHKFPTVQTAQEAVSDHAETGADHPEDLEDCWDTASAVQG